MSIDTETNSRWEPVKQMMAGAAPVELGADTAALAEHSPDEWLARLSTCKFAAKMIGPSARVLDIHCGEGMGTWILHKECGGASGLDDDKAAIEAARQNWSDAGVIFHHGDISLLNNETFDAIVMLNDVESTPDDNEWLTRIEAVAARLKPYGVAVLSATAEQCRLRQQLNALFSQVFVFSRFGELIRAGSHQGADGLLLLACRSPHVNRT